MVTVMVVPRSDPVHPAAPRPDRQFLGAVCDWLSPRRLVTTELHVRGPEVCIGFFDDPERMARVFTDDGWLRSGDLAYLDEVGFL